MLTKAILTGGVLSVLAGGVVYFGTEGADALETKAHVETHVDETVLAGGVDVAIGEIEAAAHVNVAEKVAELEVVELESTPELEAAEASPEVEVVAELAAVEAQDPPREKSKPKTKWLDQYLKKTNPEAKGKAKEDAMMVGAEEDVATEVELEIEVEADAEMETEAHKAHHGDSLPKTQGGPKKHKRIRNIKRFEDANSNAAVTGSYVVSRGNRTETHDLDTDNLDLDALDLDGDIDVEALKKQLGVDTDKDVEIRIIKKKAKMMSDAKMKMKRAKAKKRKIIDYDLVLTEAKKLHVTDMRNQAILEIVDYAVDNRDMDVAANFVSDLSTPELRDTARARIGAGFARCDKPEKAFAVIEELEIDELAAPIRLEIITALMATKQERRAFRSRQ